MDITNMIFDVSWLFSIVDTNKALPYPIYSLKILNKNNNMLFKKNNYSSERKDLQIFYGPYNP